MLDFETLSSQIRSDVRSALQLSIFIKGEHQSGPASCVRNLELFFFK